MSSIRVLTRLQDIDSEIRSRRAAQDEIHRQLEDVAALETLREEVASLKQAVAVLEKQQRSDEGDVEGIRQEVQESEAKLYGGTVHNPKELVNLQQELDGIKARQKEHEDKLLVLLTQMEEQRSALDEATTELDAAESERSELEAELGAQQKQLDQELAAYTERRSGLTGQVPSRDLALYESLLLSKAGKAIAKIERAACQGCRINLPITVQLRVRADQIISQCPSCSRILYMG